MGSSISNICADVNICKDIKNQRFDIVTDQKSLQQDINSQPLKPIEFDDIVVDSRYQDTNQISRPIQTQKKAKQQLINSNIMKSAVSKTSYIRQEDLTIIMRSQNQENRYRITQESVNIPFSVVKLIISENLKNVLQNTPDGKQFYGKYEEGYHNKRNINDWKLSKNNFYINKHPEKEGVYAIINEDYFYEGLLIEEGGKIIPYNEGVLIDINGSYNGNFNHGKAHGSGKYYSFQDRTLFDGQWQNGQFLGGVVQNDVLKFKGQFKGSYAEGYGLLQFRNNIKYKGLFKQGKYSGDDGVLQTQDYVYKGRFDGGKKHGKGTLVEYQKAAKGKKMKYKPSQRYQGQWQQDKFDRKQLLKDPKPLAIINQNNK